MNSTYCVLVDLALRSQKVIVLERFVQCSFVCMFVFITILFVYRFVCWLKEICQLEKSKAYFDHKGPRTGDLILKKKFSKKKKTKTKQNSTHEFMKVNKD